MRVLKENLIGLVAGAVALTFVVGCGPVSQRVEQSVGKRIVTGGVGKTTAASQVLRKDLLRDMGTRVTRLRAPRTVFRYMSGAEAKAVKTRGIVAGSHVTATGGRGRPLGAVRAAKRYGLPVVPSHRVSAKLPAGTRVKANKVIGGDRGFAELRVVDGVKPGNLRAPIPLTR